MGSEQQLYLIVGAGIFGVSTALHLRRSNPSATVIILDRTPYPNPSAASYDLNRIVRADYDDLFYMKLALEALEFWRNDPIYKPYYHETGMLFAENWGIGSRVLANYEIVGADHKAEMLTPEIVRTRFDGIFGDANWTDVEENFYNPNSGWGEADKCLQKMTDVAIQEGVIYVEATVTKLSIDSNRTCTGVQTEDGRELKADHVVLCTGARTALLLADTAPEDKDLQANGRIVAAGAVTCRLRLNAERMERLSKAPVMFHAMYHTNGESIPPTTNNVMKFNCELTFTNNQHHNTSNQIISVPPIPVNQNTWSQEVPQGLKEDALKVVKNIYGKELAGIEVENYRMCWDSATPNQDFIISPHAHCNHLFIAGGGSFHGWKFAPTIGKYVVQMLEGKLDEEKTRRWAWDRGAGTAGSVYTPARDLKDIAGYQSLSVS